MNPQKPYVAGVWVLGVVALIRIILFALLLYSIQHRRTDAYVGGRIISVSVLVFIFVPIIEAFIYWLLRFRIQKKVWVGIHVWTFFIATVILPLIFSWLMNYVHITPADFAFYQRLNTLAIYFSWGLLAVGHIFFIATIVRNFTQKKEIETTNESAGLLDEFIK